MAQFSLLAKIPWYVMHMGSRVRTIHQKFYYKIKTRGAMNTIITDSGKYEISKKVADLFRSLFIKQEESEPLLKNSSSPFILISSSQRSLTLLALFVVFPKDCLFTCIFHSL